MIDCYIDLFKTLSGDIAINGISHWRHTFLFWFVLNSAWDMIDYLSTKTNFILKISSNYPFLNSNNDIYLFFFFFFSFLPFKGDTSDEIVGRVSIDISDDNGANSEPHFGIHEQLCQSYPLRLPQRQFSKSFSKNYLLQTSIGAKQTIGTIDEDYESCQYRWHHLGEFPFFSSSLISLFLW